MSNGLRNWSFSTLMAYETCALRVKLDKIDKMPKPELPPDNPLERGNREHKLFEQYVKGEIPDLSGSTAKKINDFLPAFNHAQELYARCLASTEEDWLFDADWNETNRDGVWLWAKLDLSVSDDEKAIAVDYKTGKSGYKTIEHVQQLQLYAALTALKFPDVDQIVCELWYVDEGTIRTSEYTREQALAYVGRFDARAQKLMNEQNWRANPNKVNCRYCPFSPRGTGACAVGV